MRNEKLGAECGKLRAEFGVWKAESEDRCAEPAPS